MANCRVVEKEKTRCVHNAEAFLLLMGFASKHPEMRFVQILHHFGLHDRHFYEPSYTTLKYIEKKIMEFEEEQIKKE